MSGVLIHDGRRIGHRSWTVDAIRAGQASGAILTPFSTPRITKPRHPNVREVADDVREAGGEVLFDVMTHARQLPTTNRTDFYDEWELWGPSGRGVDTANRRLEHVERVFSYQTALATPLLAPTIALSSPASPEAGYVLELASLARGISGAAWQSIAGTPDFWASGSLLDAFVGTLVGLKVSTWVLTFATPLVVDAVPDFSNLDAHVGFARTVHSLSLRSRVIVAHSDFSGLPAVVAGADSVGSGWDRGQRFFDPQTFKIDSNPGPRIPASYVTQGALNAVLRRDAAEAIERYDPVRARTIRGGTMPLSDSAERGHHLAQLSMAVNSLDQFFDRSKRVAAGRARYAEAARRFDEVITNVPGSIRLTDKQKWALAPSAVVEAYATAEGY
ncbi:hypothetical protein L2091_01640 [Curtobacterium albidum]|uniref:hypothetical protein n=1 Tax=Curtobacterium citreum TaxID=2036 RepID=UPI00202646D5|nr:hypothetical protein [Curtobacterium albidum]MCL9663931.1 hypothetical protein [Curtobacterium albidum]